MGKAKGKEMLFWTKEEYLQFSEVMKDKPVSYYAFSKAESCCFIVISSGGICWNQSVCERL